MLLASSLPLLLAMSASDVLRKFVKRDVTSLESRRTLDEFLRSPCYGYFLGTLRGPDVLGYANFLDKASIYLFEALRGLTNSPGIEFDSSDGEALDKLFERSPTDMWGPSHPPHGARVVSWTDQKRKSFHYSP